MRPVNSTQHPTSFPRTRAWGFPAALIGTIAASGVFWLIRRAGGTVIFFAPFNLAIMISAYLGGFWPGILATALGVGVPMLQLWVSEGRVSFGTTDDTIRVVTFAITGLCLSVLGEMMHGALARAEARESA